MHKKLTLALTLTLLTLGAAHATEPSSSTGAQGSAQASAALSGSVQSAVLLDAQGRVVGTFDKTGRLMADSMISAATQVRVVLQGGATHTYELASRLQANASSNLNVLIVKSGEARATLASALQGSLKAGAQTQKETSAKAESEARVAASLLVGKTVTLTDSAGHAVGQFDASGALQASGDLSAAKTITVTLENGQQRSFELVGTVTAGAGKTLKVESVNVRDQTRTVALAAVLATIEKNVGVGGGADTAAESGAQPGKSVSAGGSAEGKTNAGASAGSTSSESKDSKGGAGVSIGVGVGVGIGIGGK